MLSYKPQHFFVPPMRPHNVNKSLERGRESWRSDHLSLGLIGLEFAISSPEPAPKKTRLRLSRDNPEAPFAFTPQAAAEEIDLRRK